MGLARAMQRRRRMKFEELFERRQALRVAPRGSGRGVDPAFPLGSFEIALKSDPPPDQAKTPPSQRTGEMEPPVQQPDPDFRLGGRSSASVHCSFVPEEDTPHRTVFLLPKPDTFKCY